MARITEKLRKGAVVLSDERFADCDEEDILDLVRDGKVSADQVYGELRKRGYRWRRDDWRPAREPAWFELARQRFVERYKDLIEE